MPTTYRTVPAAVPPDLAIRLPEFRAALEEQRQFRLEQLHELAVAAPNPSPAADDVHDHVSEILRVGAAAALTEVEDALGRLRAGTYGICERCTKPILCERLEILPMARHCMRCQHDLETRLG